MQILKFIPLLIPTVWGGQRIAQMKRIAQTDQPIGESWELSGLAGEESVVAEGQHAGTPINTLVQTYGATLMGEGIVERFGTSFPLLIKFIDAATDLSLQVHPDDTIAQRNGEPNGKTEAWFVKAATPDARLMAGFTHAFTLDEFSAAIADYSICDHIVTYRPQAGDCFNIPAGRIHSICAGAFIIEVQQTSNTTYRVFDYNRLGLDGRPRKLHLEQALACTDLGVAKDAKVHYTPQEDAVVPLMSNTYFAINRIDLTAPLDLVLPEVRSFRIYIAHSGAGSVVTADGTTTTITEGETILVPACQPTLRFIPSAEGLGLIEAHIDHAATAAAPTIAPVA